MYDREFKKKVKFSSGTQHGEQLSSQKIMKCKEKLYKKATGGYNV